MHAIEASFDAHGYEQIPAILSSAEVAAVSSSLSTITEARNLLDNAWCKALSRRIVLHPAVAKILYSAPVCIQCTYFEKNAHRNWLVALHQDLVVPARDRVEHTSLKAWSQKDGQHFVQAPTRLLDQLVAVRLHIDACGAENGPLRLVAGSHRYGKLSLERSAALREEFGEVTCTASVGDALLMRPLVLHASSKAMIPNRRRVLHFLFWTCVPGLRAAMAASGLIA